MNPARIPLGPRATWEDVMMAIARAAGSRSRDATTRVGAVVCTSDWRVIGTGYNGPPAGSPNDLPMAGPERHPWVIHSEENALIQAVATMGTTNLSGCRLFCTHKPCIACILRTSHCRINEIVYDVDELSEEQHVSSGIAAFKLKVIVRRSG